MDHVIVRWYLRTSLVKKALRLHKKISKTDHTVLQEWVWGKLINDPEGGMRFETTLDCVGRCISFLKEFHKENEVPFTFGTLNAVQAQASWGGNMDKFAEIAQDLGMTQNTEFEHIWNLV